MMKYDVKKLARDFWYGKPVGERRLGDIREPKTGLCKHREWRGFVDTMYYFNRIWLYNYGRIVGGILENGGLAGVVNVAKGVMRYRWMGQTYPTVLHWFDRGLEGLRGEALRASAWHYHGLVMGTVVQFMNMFNADANLHHGKHNDAWHHTLAHNETVWGGIFYPWSDRFKNVSMEMCPYFLTVHTNSHTVLNYIDAVQSIGVPGDTCPMCQAESGLFVLDDIPDYSPLTITCNEACDASVSTSVLQDWFFDKPLYALPMPMQFDDPLVKENCVKEIEGCWKFIEDQTACRSTGICSSRRSSARMNCRSLSGRSGKSPPRRTITRSTAWRRPCSAFSTPSTATRTSGTSAARKPARSWKSARRRRSTASPTPVTARSRGRARRCTTPTDAPGRITAGASTRS